MGQKTDPRGFRVGVTKDWDSKWFTTSKKEFSQNLIEDAKIREFIKNNFDYAGIATIEIARTEDKVTVNLYTARPGVVIGRRGAEVDRIRDEIQEITGKQVEINIKEITNSFLDAQLIAENVALQLEKRTHFRRAMKRAVNQAMEAGAKGVKIKCSGRLGGAEIARSEWYKDGKIPLQTLRAEVAYGFSEAKTKYGVIGVKVWLYRGDLIMDKEKEKVDSDAVNSQAS
ncbi:30S ribosomal protein S3 [Candidatus Calescamantes bacterium]|nr:30S ribosomal protein S3 [Candidatus Calescamantes bacterium]